MKEQRKKPTQDEIDEALNPILSKIDIDAGKIKVKIQIMTFGIEKEFLKCIKDVANSVDGTREIKEIINNLPTETLVKMTELILKNSGFEESSAQFVEENCSVVGMVEMIVAQVNKQRYLDFLASMASLLPSLGKLTSI